MDVVERQYNNNKKGKTFYELELKPSVYLLYFFWQWYVFAKEIIWHSEHKDPL